MESLAPGQASWMRIWAFTDSRKAVLVHSSQPHFLLAPWRSDCNCHQGITRGRSHTLPCVPHWGLCCAGLWVPNPYPGEAPSLIINLVDSRWQILNWGTLESWGKPQKIISTSFLPAKETRWPMCVWIHDSSTWNSLPVFNWNSLPWPLWPGPDPWCCVGLLQGNASAGRVINSRTAETMLFIVLRHEKPSQGAGKVDLQ